MIFTHHSKLLISKTVIKIKNVFMVHAYLNKYLKVNLKLNYVYVTGQIYI